jgi:dTDP-4-amino-4,6-dideoxygalactose transaminase
MKSAELRQIPLFRPDIGPAEIDEVVDTLRSGWLTTGPKAQCLEREFAEAVGARHALAVNSCTAALHLALDAVGIREGDEVIVPSMTFSATANVVVHYGARPVIVDCRADTLNIDPERVEAALTPRTRAILPVHFGGHPCDMDALHALARSRGLRVIEDAAHAVPARYRGRAIGEISDLTCFSLYANKTITAGEGGILTGDDDALMRRARLMSWHGIDKQPQRGPEQGAWYYELRAAGWKYNMPDVAAAIGIHQLRRREALWRRRQHCAELYAKGLADVPELRLPHAEPDVQHAWHLYVIRLDLERLSITRQHFIECMQEAGVGTGVHYIPLHLQPYYRDVWGCRPESYPVTTAAYEQIVSLPIHSGLEDAEVEYVVDAVKTVTARYRR